MSMQEDIRNLVLGFFDAIDADIASTDDDTHVIRVPKPYRHVFGSQELRVAFDRDASPKHDYELVAPGNRILSQVIEICANKGPVKVKRSDNSDDNAIIRYHFFIHFSGQSDMLLTDHVDVELAPSSDADTSSRGGDAQSLDWMDSGEVTRTYSTALKELQRRHDVASLAFLRDANIGFVDDVRLFTAKYDLRVRELDDTIKHKDRGSSGSDKAREFRFQVVDKIDALEEEKRILIDTIQKKHRVLLSYGLVACEVILHQSSIQE